MTRWPGLVWDACGLLNLAATTRAQDILVALDCPSFVVKQVYESEVIYLRPLPEEEFQGPLKRVDFGREIEQNFLKIVDLSEAEEELFVNLASIVDDGEARSLACAIHRKLPIVTDDRQTLRLASSLSPPTPAITTPDWLKEWSDQTQETAIPLTEVIRRIRLCARYQPPRDHPMKSWWDLHCIIE